MAKRRGLSQKVRFEVFKRDRFKCMYCGRCAPDVVLHVDHIQPVSKEGTNDLINLITACVDCNSGKGARELGDDSAVARQRAQLEELNERREQLDMMLAWRKGLQGLGDAEVHAAIERYRELIPGWSLNELGQRQLRKLIADHALARVLDALEKAALKYVEIKNGKATPESADLAWKRIPGILVLDSQPEDVRQLYYVRGIMRKRFRYCPEAKALQMLKEAREQGAEIDELRGLVCECRTWSQFVVALERDYGVKE